MHIATKIITSFIYNMKITDYKTNLSFNAKIGDNLSKRISDGFNNNPAKIDKFKNLFDTTFHNVMDEGTIVEINDEGRYLLSHELFPDIILMLRQHVLDRRPLAEAIIVECPKTFGWGESLLFKKIVREQLKQIDYSKLESIAQLGIKNDKRKYDFLEIIECAKQIKDNNPDSELSDAEFELVENERLQEKTETPGTKEYNIVHSILKRLSHAYTTGEPQQ